MVKQATLDFTNVKEGGNFSKKHMPAGDYSARVIKVEDAVAKGDKKDQWLFTIQLTNTPSAKYPYYVKYSEANQLWKIRNLFVAAGLKVPKKRVKINPELVVGKIIAVSLDDAEYDGKDQSEISAVFPVTELDGVSDEPAGDDEADGDDEAEAEEDEDTDELAGLDRGELKQRLVKADPDAKVKKSMSDDDIRDLVRAAEAKSDDDDELEEIDVDEV